MGKQPPGGGAGERWLLEVGREVTDAAEGCKQMIFQQFPAHSYTLFWTSHQSQKQDQERLKEAHELNLAFLKVRVIICEV